jgi:PAS domain S-box-containing protein
VLDVNEIASFEEKLVEREIVLKKAQEVSRLGYWKYIPSTGEVTGSEELYRVFGLEIGEFNNVDTFFSVIHPNDIEHVSTSLRRCAELGERLDIKFRLACRDATQKWLRAVAEAITDESDGVIYLIGTTQDVTDIEASNRALRESELWMTSIFNSLDEAVLVVSPERELINVNKAAEEIFGYSAEEIFNSPTELFHVDHQHYLEFGERIKQAFNEDRTAKFEFEARRKNGEIFPTEHTVSLLKDHDGEIKGIVSVVKDITERKSAEQNLLKNEARLNEAQRIAKVGAWELDLLSNELTWSDEVFRIFDIDKKSFPPSYEVFLDFIHPEDREMVDKAYSDSLISKEPYEIEHRLVLSDGKVKYVHEKCETFFDLNGKAIRSVGTVHDITERKLVEDELERSKARFEAMFESMPDAIVFASLDRRIQLVNNAAKKMYGYDESELLGNQTIMLYALPGDFERTGIEHFNPNANPDETSLPYVVDYKCKSGRIFQGETTGIPVTSSSGEIIGYLALVRDITERRKTEEELARVQALLKKGNSIARLGAWSLDLQSNKLVWSDITKEIHEVDADFNPDVDSAINFYKEGADRDTINRIVKDALTNGGTWDEELVIVTAKGNEKWVRAMGQPEFKGGVCVRLFGSFQDISERKQAEEALVKSEARYRRAEEGTNDGLWEWNVATGDDYFSPRWLAMLGYQVDELPYYVDTFVELIHPDDLAMVKVAMERHLQNNDPYNIEMRLRHKNGDYVWVQSRGQVERDEEGNPTIMTGFITNIVERKKAEEELARIQAMLKQANRISRMGAWTYDLQSNELEWSDVTKEIHEVDLDYKPNLEAGVNFYKEGVNRDTISHAVKNAIENASSWDEELVIVTAKGNEKWVRAMGRPEFKNGVCMRLNGSFQDISERKQAEEEFKRIFELSPDMVGTGNLQGYFTRINSSFGRILGYDDKEFMAKPFIEYVHKDDVGTTMEALKNALKGERDLKVYNRYFCKDGSIKWIEWDVLAIADENIFYTTGRDITERKQYEDELQKYRYKLEDMVAERTQELLKSLAEKEVLLKEVHHRVKNNMAMISAFIRLQMPGIKEGSAMDALVACENRIQAMSMVHKRLYQSDDFTSINMQVLLSEICNALYEKENDKNVNLEILVTNVSLEMDFAIPCALIVSELVTNSLKHAFEDERRGKISIIMGQEAGSLYRLLVSDNGKGFASPIDLENADTLGLQLVNVFIGQLNGEVKTSGDNGFSIEIVFSADDAKNT